MSTTKKTAILVAFAILINALLSIFIWGHRMFVTGVNPFREAAELLLFLLIAIALVIVGVKKLGKYVGFRCNRHYLIGQ